MTLERLVFAGAVGGCVTIFSSWLIIGHLFHRYQSLTPGTWRPEGPRQYAWSSVLQVFAGAAVGSLFFVTGGGAGLEQGWAVRGIVFGGLAWLAVACPIHLTTALYVRLHIGHVVGALLDSLAGLMIVSCACAFAAR